MKMTTRKAERLEIQRMELRLQLLKRPVSAVRNPMAHDLALALSGKPLLPDDYSYVDRCEKEVEVQ